MTGWGSGRTFDTLAEAMANAVDIHGHPAPPDVPDNPRVLPRLRYELTLPFPPSVNRLWRYVGRGKVIRSPDYDRWLKTCDGLTLEQLGIPAYRAPIRGKYTLELTLCETRFGSVDQDNCCKAVSDALQRNNVIANDKFAWKTSILWGFVNAKTRPHENSPLCLVKVEAF